MRSIIKAYEDGTLKQIQEQERAALQLVQPAQNPTDADDVGCDDYDENDSEPWCDECHNMGEIDCHCGGDLCVCSNNGYMLCPKCGGY